MLKFAMILLAAFVELIAFVFLFFSNDTMMTCGDEYRRAALSKVRWVEAVPAHVCFPLRACDDESLSHYAQKSKELRAWAATLPNDCVRNAYSIWADYVDNRLAVAKKERETELRRSALVLPIPPS